MKEEVLSLRIYDKRDWSEQYSRYVWIGTAIYSIPLILIFSTNTNEEIGVNPFLKGYCWLMIPVFIIVGVFGVIDKYESYMKTHGPIELLSLYNQTIKLFDQEIPYSNITHITIRIRDNEEQSLHSANNYMKIEMNSVTHELAVVIDSNDELENLTKTVQHLKNKGVSVHFKNYL